MRKPTPDGELLKREPNFTHLLLIVSASGRSCPDRSRHGTADAIIFRNDFLRIHDLKTGETPAKMEQLMIYAALFCLEYGIKPSEIGMELRIYQNDEVLCHNATVEDIFPIMDRIITFDKIINRMREQEGVNHESNSGR